MIILKTLYYKVLCMVLKTLAFSAQVLLVLKKAIQTTDRKMTLSLPFC